MRFLIDMNLSPQWVDFLKEFNFESRHWSQTGDIRASDKEIFDWSRENDFIIITQDLDFSTLLALSNSEKPSVILIRTKNSLPEQFGQILINVLKKYSKELKAGAHIVLDSISSRIRILPLNQ